MLGANFKGWSVIDLEGNFVVAILVAPDFQGLPDIPEQFRRMAHNHPKLVDGIPGNEWMRWIHNHWEARPGSPPLVSAHSDV